MVVSCPKCDSRYQLSDDKVRATGTKVRCPRCQHTFKVYMTEGDSENMDRTEFLSRPAEVAKKESPFTGHRKPVAEVSEVSAPTRKTEPQTETTRRAQAPAPVPKSVPVQAPEPRKPPPAPVFDESAGFTEFDAPTRAQAPKSSSRSVESSRDPSPFRKTTAAETNIQTNLGPSEDSEDFKIVSNVEDRAPLLTDLKSKRQSNIPEMPMPKTDISGASAVARPFGEATFLAIQQMAKPRSWMKALSIMLVVGAAVAGTAFFVIQNSKNRNVAQVAKPVATNRTTVYRPAGWYQDDPSLFQAELGRLASLPAKEKEKPENRSLVAEALILNGILNGADDDISSGLAKASGLVTVSPNAVYGYYPLVVYAMWREDFATLSDLVSRWPTGNQTDPEFRLAKALLAIRSTNRNTDAKQGMEELKKVVEEFPDFHLAYYFVYDTYLQNAVDAQSVLGKNLIEEAQRIYLRHKEQFHGNLPVLFQGIEKRAAKARLAPPSVIVKREKELPIVAKKDPELFRPAPSRAEIDHTRELNERAARKLDEQSHAATAQANAKTKSKLTKQNVARGKTGLPKAAPDLVAANRRDKKSKIQSDKMLAQANGLYSDDRVEEALILYRKVILLNPEQAEAYKKLGQIYMGRPEKESKDRALKAFKTYLQLRPQGEDKQLVEGWISSLQ